MRARGPGRPAALVALLAVVACGDGPVDPPSGTGSALVIAPGSLLLAEAGATQALRAYAVDADGDSTEVAATFTSSDPGIVSVSSTGLATGGASLGAATIVATSGELTSAPILALRATPSAGAMLVADSQVVGGVEAVDPGAPYAAGRQYRVRLRGATPSVGQIVLATGGAPIGGRVVSVAGGGAGADVVIAMVPLGELFDALSVDVRLPLGGAIEPPPSQERHGVRLSRSPHGGTRFSTAPGARFTASSIRAPSGRIEQEFQLGPFTCKLEVPAPLSVPISMSSFSGDLNESLALDLVVEDAGVRRLVVDGTIRPTLTVAPRITAALEGKAECKYKVREFPLPITGVLSAVLGGQVPVGIGFEIGAKSTLGQLGADVTFQSTVAAQLGFDCTAVCEWVQAFGATAPEVTVKPVVPDLGTSTRIELGAAAFGWAELTLGLALWDDETSRLRLLSAKGGLEQKFELAPAEAQAADPGYASSFSLKPVVEVKAAAEYAPLENMLQVALTLFTYAPELPPISRSPHGTFTITPASVAAGDGSQIGERATFTVTLADPTFLGAYAVEAVQIRWRRDVSGTVFLESGRPGCTDLAAAQDQLVFSCETDFLEEHAGAQTFHAFVKARIFGIPIPVPLEVAPDGKATVTVTGGAVSVEPSTVTLAPGQSQEFTAHVAGGNGGAVTWSATGGTFTATGNTLVYTAGAQPGTYNVTATSVASPDFSASAVVTITAPASGSVTLVNAGGFAQTFISLPGGIACNHIDESSEQEAFTASRTFTSQCSGSWTSHPGDAPATLTGSAAANVSYQLAISGSAVSSISASGNATASATAQGGPGIVVGGKGEAYSSDAWFDFEVDETVTVTLTGQVSSGGSSTFESPRAFVSLDQAFSGTIFIAEQGAIATTLTLTPGRYTLRVDAYADAPVSLPDRTTSNSSASFNVTMTVGQ
ncbi:MAG TPA: hypothetical protein VF037_10910 [Gemmatimonadales bacterium]